MTQTGDRYAIYPYGDYTDVMTYQGLLRLEKHLSEKQKDANSMSFCHVYNLQT